MFFQRLDGSIDEDRLVRNDLGVDARRQTLTDLIELAFHEIDDCNRIRARLAANIKLYGLFAVNHIPGRRLGVTIFDAPDIADPARRSFEGPGEDVAHPADGCHP